MTAQASGSRDRVSVVELALLRGITYQRAYNEALQGVHGRPERIGRKLYVRMQDVARREARSRS
jgi:hypothetical protein